MLEGYKAAKLQLKSTGERFISPLKKYMYIYVMHLFEAARQLLSYSLHSALVVLRGCSEAEAEGVF